MLYGVGTHLGGASAAIAPSTVCSDTDDIINDWDPEVFTVSQSVKTYSAGIASQSWASVDTFTGDWQPVSAYMMRAEEGRKVKSDAFITTPCVLDSGSTVDSVIDEGDRIYKPDGSFMYVNYLKVYRGHITIFLRRTKGSE